MSNEAQIELVEHKPGAVNVDEALVQQALEELHCRMVVGASATALSVGEYLLGAFFGGDASRYRSRRRDGNPSFDALLDRPELVQLGLSRSGLYNCIGIWMQLEALGMKELRGLSVSHQVALLPAPEDHKRSLAMMALERGLSVRRLRMQVDAARKEARGDRKVGRPPLPAFVKGMTRLRNAVELALSEDVSEADFLHYRPDDARQLMRELDRHVEALIALKQKVYLAAVTFEAGLEDSRVEQSGQHDPESIEELDVELSEA